LPLHGGPIQLLVWIRYRGRGLVLTFGRAAFSWDLTEWTLKPSLGNALTVGEKRRKS